MGYRSRPKFDLLGQCLKRSCAFRGKGRLISYWMRTRDTAAVRARTLPGGGQVLCDLAVPYEAMVWLAQEEEVELNALRRLLSPGGVFVDCGANIGIWSIAASAAVGRHGTVHAFEPNPTTAVKLARNAALAPYPNICITPVAVGSSQGELLLRCDSQHNISQVVREESADAVRVKVTTLDAALGDLRVAGCKIDVEGYELEVLKGAERVLTQHRPWLCVEYNTLLTDTNHLCDWPVHGYLRSLGYLARLFCDREGQRPGMPLADLWQTSGYCNLLYTADGL